MGVSTHFMISFVQEMFKSLEIDDPFTGTSAVDSYEADQVMSGMPAVTGYFYAIAPESSFAFFEVDGGQLHTVFLETDWVTLDVDDAGMIGALTGALLVLFEPDGDLRDELNTYVDFAEIQQDGLSTFEGSIADWTFIGEDGTFVILIQAP